MATVPDWCSEGNKSIEMMRKRVGTEPLIYSIN